MESSRWGCRVDVNLSVRVSAFALPRCAVACPRPRPDADQCAVCQWQRQRLAAVAVRAPGEAAQAGPCSQAERGAQAGPSAQAHRPQRRALPPLGGRAIQRAGAAVPSLPPRSGPPVRARPARRRGSSAPCQDAVCQCVVACTRPRSDRTGSLAGRSLVVVLVVVRSWWWWWWWYIFSLSFLSLARRRRART